MIGNIAVSVAGHDREKPYVIVKEDDKYVYLCDGRQKTLAAPKKKNRKHVRIDESCDTGQTAEKLRNKEPIWDYEIKRSIKMFQMQIKKAEE